MQPLASWIQLHPPLYYKLLVSEHITHDYSDKTHVALNCSSIYQYSYHVSLSGQSFQLFLIHIILLIISIQNLPHTRFLINLLFKSFDFQSNLTSVSSLVVISSVVVALTTMLSTYSVMWITESASGRNMHENGIDPCFVAHFLPFLPLLSCCNQNSRAAEAF